MQNDSTPAFFLESVVRLLQSLAVSEVFAAARQQLFLVLPLLVVVFSALVIFTLALFRLRIRLGHRNWCAGFRLS